MNKAVIYVRFSSDKQTEDSIEVYGVRCGAQMKKLKDEITALESTEPPKDFTVEQIRAWMDAVKAAPDEQAVHLLIERIEKKDDGFHAKSTLEAVLVHIISGYT